jgi:type IV secretion system protein VirB10
MGSSLATSTGRVLDRFLNVLPTITIREGHRVKVYLTSDLDLPEYITDTTPR